MESKTYRVRVRTYEQATPGKGVVELRTTSACEAIKQAHHWLVEAGLTPCFISADTTDDSGEFVSVTFPDRRTV